LSEGRGAKERAMTITKLLKRFPDGQQLSHVLKSFGHAKPSSFVL
jgi:hypothetical protein